MLPDGTCVRVDDQVGAAALRQVMAVLRGCFPTASGVRVWLASGHADMRRGMRGLALQAQEGLGRDPFAGDVYLFRGGSGALLKALWHDGIGLLLYAK